VGRTMSPTNGMVVLGVAALLAAAPAKVPKSKTVVVDCRKGESLAAALGEEAEQLIVEIHGICSEDTKVLRGNVTIRGTDPAVDGIRGVAKAGSASSLGATTAALEVRGSGVVIEKLRLTGGALYGLLVVGSQGTEVRNCRLVENGELGASFTGASAAVVYDTTVSGNGAGGVRVNRSSVVNFRGCALRDNPSPGAGIGLEAINGGRALLDDSRVQGLVGVNVMNGGMVGLSASEVEGASVGLSVKGLGHMELTNVALRGAIAASSRSLVVLRGVDQIANSRKNTVVADSTLQLLNASSAGSETGEAGAVGTSLLGPTEVRQFSRLIFQGDALLSGDLTCSSGGDAFCADPGKVAGTVADCRSCRPKPAQ
jgi:hypothetical protein